MNLVVSFFSCPLRKSVLEMAEIIELVKIDTFENAHNVILFGVYENRFEYVEGMMQLTMSASIVQL